MSRSKQRIGLGAKTLSIIALSLLQLSCSWLLSDEPDSSFDGMWKSEGSSFYLHIEGGIARRYQYTSISCFLAPAGYLPAVSYVGRGKINDWATIERPTADSLLITRPQDSLPVKMHAVDKLPSACFIDPVGTALMDIEIAWQTVYENFASFDQRRVDWEALHQKYLNEALAIDLEMFPNQLEEELKAFHLVDEMLSELNDDHVFLIAPALGKLRFPSLDGEAYPYESYEDEEFVRRYLDMLGANYGRGRVRYYANERLAFFPLSHRVGYLNIGDLREFAKGDNYGAKSMAALRRGMDAIARRSEQLDLLIIDLRFNSGGSIAFANAIAAYFGRENSDTLLLTTKLNRYESEGFTKPRVAGYIKPNYSVLSKKRIYLLTSRYTASAAEYLAQNLKSVGAFHLGETTRGIFSPVLVRSLSREVYFSVSNQRAVTQDGAPLEGIGIVPDLIMSSQVEKNLEKQVDPLVVSVLEDDQDNGNRVSTLK